MKKNRTSLYRESFIPIRKYLRIMKLTFTLLLLGLMSFASVTYSQATKLTFESKNSSIESVFKQIETLSEFKFAYNSTKLDVDKKISIKVENQTIDAILDKILGSANFQYKIVDRYIIITDENGNNSGSIENGQSSKKVTGKVTDTSGNSLPGVSVVIKGTTNGIITDSDGKYSLSGIPENATLQFSFVGMKMQDVKVGNQTSIDVTLTEETIGIDEVVAIGYAVQKKKLVTGATSQVKNEELVKNHSVRLESAIQGMTPGMSITQKSGQPGADFNIIIRGMGSINGSNPLILIDGVPGSLNSINPQDVETIDILKDAASAAIYGSRAAGGVILVTTKKGSKGEMQVTYDGYYGIANAYRKLPMLNAKEYASIMNEAAVNSGQLPSFTIGQINSFGKGTDWQQESYNKNAPTTSHYISLTGGNEKSSYAVSLSYRKQEGIISIENKSQRENMGFHMSTQQNGKKWLKTGQNITYNHTNSGSIDDGNQWVNNQRGILTSSPLIPLYDPSQEDGYGRSSFSANQTNPIASMHYKYNSKNKSDNLMGNVFAELEIIKGLKFKSDFGMNLDISTTQTYSPIYDLSPNDKTTATSATQGMYRTFSYNWDNTLTYQKLFNKHDIMVMLGQNAQDMRYTFVQGVKSDLIIADFEHAVLNNATNLTSAQTTGTVEPQDTRFSVFGRLSYSYDDKYLATVTLRRDGSSRFGPDNRFGYFPSVSAGWVISQEKFLQSATSWLDFLKIRASWGQNGREPYDRYIFMPTITTTDRGYYFGPDESNATFYNGASPERIPSPGLKWEAATETNVGFDSRFLGDFSLTIDLYNRTSKDWIVQVPVKAITGISSPMPYINGGNVINKGIEFELGYTKTIQDWKFNVKGNIAYNKNKVTDIPNDEKIIHGSSSLFNQAAEVCRVQEGYPIGYFWGYKTGGIFQTKQEIDNYIHNGSLIQPDAKPGDVKFVDLNHDGKIDDLDKTILGKGMPDYIYGLSLSASYKGFDFSLNLQGQIGNQIVQSYRDPGNWYANYSTEILGRWTGPGTSNKIPRVTFGNDPNQNMSKISDLYVQDADFLRVKSINIGYDLKKLLLSNVPIQQCRVYLSGTNLLTFTKYNGLDPEVGFSGGYDNFSSGIDVGFYPTPRTYLIGINVTF